MAKTYRRSSDVGAWLAFVAMALATWPKIATADPDASSGQQSIIVFSADDGMGGSVEAVVPTMATCLALIAEAEQYGSNEAKCEVRSVDEIIEELGGEIA